MVFRFQNNIILEQIIKLKKKKSIAWLKICIVKKKVKFEEDLVARGYCDDTEKWSSLSPEPVFSIPSPGTEMFW